MIKWELSEVLKEVFVLPLLKKPGFNNKTEQFLLFYILFWGEEGDWEHSGANTQRALEDMD